MKNKSNPELIDETNPEWTEKMFNEALPASQILPELLESYNENTQITTTISFDTKVLEIFKSINLKFRTINIYPVSYF
jgi:hypothetical protein